MKAKDRRAAEAGRRGNRRRERGGGGLRRELSSYGDRSARVVYFAAEGKVTEYDYAKFLHDKYGKKGGRDLFRFELCGRKDGLRPKEVVECVSATAEPGDEMWALFDRDVEDNRNDEIPAAMREAAARGVQVALSHPSFELWLLLHFQEFTSREGGRDKSVKERLRTHPEAAGFEQYDKASGDRGKRLDDARKATLGMDGRVQKAADRARKLVDRCPHRRCGHEQVNSGNPEGVTGTAEAWTPRTGHAPDCNPLHRDPSSDVWRLLESLGIG